LLTLQRYVRISGLLLKLFNENNEISIGKVLSPHGVSGLVKVFPYTDFPERISLLQAVDLLTDKERKRHVIEKGSIYGRFWLVKFSGINNREEAAGLNGRLMVIPREERIPLPEGSFYHDQLIGLQIKSIQGEFIGIITDIITTGGHDLLVVDRPEPAQKQILIPAVVRFIREVNIIEECVLVDLPDGLVDL
jgi:16S rRNA processing protein RimM